MNYQPLLDHICDVRQERRRRRDRRDHAGEFSGLAGCSPELDRSGDSLVGTAALKLLTSVSGKSTFSILFRM
jgi:hypothetical protein